MKYKATILGCLFGTTIGFVVTGLVQFFRTAFKGASAGDWLGFTGGLLGIPATVATTVLAQKIWTVLERRQKHRKLNVNLQFLAGCIASVCDPDRRSPVAVSSAIDIIDRFDWVRDQLDVTDYVTFTSLQTLGDTLGKVRNIIERLVDIEARIEETGTSTRLPEEITSLDNDLRELGTELTNTIAGVVRVSAKAKRAGM